jgi:hypothetical protein
VNYSTGKYSVGERLIFRLADSFRRAIHYLTNLRDFTGGTAYGHLTFAVLVYYRLFRNGVPEPELVYVFPKKTELCLSICEMCDGA